MKVLKKMSHWVGKYMALIVLAVAALALFAPSSVSFIKTAYVTNLLMIVMFGMGLTLHPKDFRLVFLRPWDVFLGVGAQFIIMPFLSFLLVKAFNLPLELAVGVILVGTCPGGTSSNVMTFLAKGDVALSVAMTSVTTLLAPLMTPFLTLLLAGQRVDVNAMGMFISIVQVVVLPIGLGLTLNLMFHRFTSKITAILPMVSVGAIVAIVAAVVSANAPRIMTTGMLIAAVVVLHNLLGYLLGYAAAKALGLDYKKVCAISIEVGMQNSGLATSLATKHFASMPMAAIPGALFSVWHNISGSIVANIMASKHKNEIG